MTLRVYAHADGPEVFHPHVHVIPRYQERATLALGLDAAALQ